MGANLAVFAAALVATLALTPMARGLALRWGIVDCPDGRRKLQKRPVPLLGGLAVFGGWWLGLAVSAALGIPLRLPAAMPQAGITLAALSLIGICDDARNLRARWKLLAQIMATLPIALSGCGLDHIACCGWTVDLGVWGPAVTVMWLIVGINALNLIDGMDGMASLTGLCICLTAAALDMQSGGSHVGTFTLGLAGALTGFLVFNFPPAKIYLGDTGSMIIGLALALASMRVARTDSGVTNLTPMLALMALPLADTTLAVLRRSLSGRGIWYPDRGHVHHRLLDRGMSARRVLTLVAGFSAVWGIVIVASAGNGDAERVVWIAASLLALVAVRWRLAGHHEWSLLANTVWNSVRPRADLPTPSELESLPFADTWKRLQAAVEPYPLERLSLYVRGADGSICEHDWLQATSPAGRAEPLAIEVSRLAGVTICRLRVETSKGQILQQMSQLLEVLERFAEFWVAHPATVPKAGLRFSPSAGPVIVGRLSLPKVPEQSRAA